ncbi:MAG: FAD-binding oxidoreductase [Pseudomonadota bacterium]|nr:FAD-binding oxidoreductase [Pseudomonadota bacterium]
MSATNLRTLAGHDTVIASESIEAFEATVRGPVLRPESPGYDEVREIWNAMIDRRPGLITRCAGAADVMHAVRFAREHGLLVSVRGAGHNIAGNAISDGGLLIDLSEMKSVRVDTATKSVRVEPGVTLGELDHETQAFGLAVPVGINSTTGVAGLTLGGGFGWISRRYGMTIDNLLSADVVTAEGELRHVSANENSDLFWGIRGGGGNFGVVTSFEFQAHEVGPMVTAGLIFHPLEAAGSVLKAWREFAAEAPDELTVWVVLREAPPLPDLPVHVHGTGVIAIAALYAGDPADGEKVLAPIRAFGDPIADLIGPAPFAGFQSAFDPLLTPGARNYWKSHDFIEISDELIGHVLDYADRLPSGECEIFIAQVGGAMGRVPAEATAYTHREANFVMNVHTRWRDATQDQECIDWAREFFDKTAPHATGGVYVNFMTQDEGGRIGEAYGANYDRLVKLKKRYDPDNMFRLNQNIAPDG